MSATARDPREVRLAELIVERRNAKRAEDEAVAERRKVDAQILAEFSAPASGKGTVSEAVGDIKLAITYSLDRKVDTDAVKAAFETLPPAVQSAFRFKAEVDAKAYDVLSEDDKLAAAKFITTKPASPSLKLELAA